MTDAKISALADIVTLAAADKVAVADASDLTASKSATMTEINAYLQTLPLASAQITTLNSAVFIDSTDRFVIDQSGAAQSVTRTVLVNALQALGMPRVIALTGDYTNNSTTGTEITNLSFTTLVAGTYLARWTLFVASSVATSTFKFGVNYTGTVTRMMNMAQFPSAGTNAVTGTLIDVANATTGQILGYANSTTESTTAPNLGPWTDVTNVNLFHRIMVESLVVVSDGGDLELWAGIETATGSPTMTVKAGSSGVLVRTV